MNIKVNTVKSYGVELSEQELRYLRDILESTTLVSNDQGHDVLKVNNEDLVFDANTLDIFMGDLYELIEGTLEEHE